MGDEAQPEVAPRRHFARGTLEFGRVVNLSDGLFAISLTLLVFTLDASAVSLDGIGAAFRDQTGELIAFAVSFAVIANFWWIHHRFLTNVGTLEPVLVLLNLGLLGAVAVLPFFTSLLGRDPAAGAAVVPYLGLLSVVAVLHLLLLVRAHGVAAWRHPMPAGLYPWLLAGWGATAAI